MSQKPMPGDTVGVCYECGEHEFISNGIEYHGHFHCNDCSGKPKWQGDPEDGKEKKMILHDDIPDGPNKFMEGAEPLLYTLADLEKAREDGATEEREVIAFTVRALGRSVATNKNAELCDEIADTILSLGPVSSIEERVRRETVEKIRRRSSRWQNTCRSSYTISTEDLEAIAEGGKDEI